MTTDAGIMTTTDGKSPVLALQLTTQELEDLLAWAEERKTNLFDLCRSTLMDAVAA